MVNPVTDRGYLIIASRNSCKEIASTNRTQQGTLLFVEKNNHKKQKRDKNGERKGFLRAV